MSKNICTSFFTAALLSAFAVNAFAASPIVIDPEFAPTSHIVISSGGVFPWERMVAEGPVDFPQMHAKIKEIRNALKQITISSQAAGAKVIAVSPTKYFDGEAFPGLELMKAWFDSEGIKGVEHVAGDEPDLWARDFIGWSASTANAEKFHVALSADRSKDVNTKIAGTLAKQLNLIDAPESFEGGNILVAADGSCFLSAVDEEEAIDAKFPCAKVHKLRALPLEGTGHVDLYAKFLDANTVAVAEYADSNFLYAENPETHTYVCNDEQVKKRLWHDCEFKHGHADPGYKISSKDLPKNLLETAEKRYRGEYNVIASSFTGNVRASDDIDLVAHGNEIADFFKSLGYQVVRIKNPPPKQMLELSHYENSKGEIVMKTLGTDYVFPSYLNALQVNKGMIMPTYASAGGDYDLAAKKVYEAHGFHVSTIEADEIIKASGSIHCMSKDLHY